MSSDYRDLLREFNAHDVEYLVVGAHALAAHGHPRATKDLDVWVRPQLDNARRVLEALRAFGAPLQDLTAADLAAPGVFFQIGVPPLRIDVLTRIDGVGFDEAGAARSPESFEREPIHVLSRTHLIRNKQASGRLQDLADVESLRNDAED